MQSFAINMCLFLPFLLLSNPVCSKILIPSPTNATYGTNIEVLELVDTNRTDPYDPDGGSRRLMVSVVYPTMPACECLPSSDFYATGSIAGAIDTALQQFGFSNMSNEVSGLAVSTCPARANETLPETFPKVLFSPGYSNSRLLSMAQAQAVAAEGYNVITIDHPYDAQAIDYPDGSIVHGIDFTTSSDLDEGVRVRSRDISFVIDQLADQKSALYRFGSRGKIGIFGHSLGGSTAIRAAYDDKRVVAALDLDGTPYGFNTSGTRDDPTFALPKIKSPCLLFNAESSLSGSGWSTMIEALSGWHMRFGLAKSTHISFTDWPLLMDVLGVRDQLSPEVLALIGMIDGVRARDAVAAYVVAYMNMFLKGETSSLLLGMSSEIWPEVEIVK